METCDVPEGATLLIDGQALVVSLGKPQSHLCHTFGDLSNIFLNAVYQYGYRFARIDVVFDRYDPLSMGRDSNQNEKEGQFVILSDKPPPWRMSCGKFEFSPPKPCLGCTALTNFTRNVLRY